MLSKSSAATSQGLIQKEKVHIEYKQGDQQGYNTMKTQYFHYKNQTNCTFNYNFSFS